MGVISQKKKRTYRPNYCELITVDLGVARAVATSVLSGTTTGEGLVPISTAGTFTITIEFEDGSTLALTQAQYSLVQAFNISFADVLFTNTAQPGVSVVFILEDVR